jgi:S1-C subfamily serine protease
VVGADKPTDVALLRIEPRAPLPPVELGAAADVRVGQWVLAIGNPYGLDGTVSLGIVSAKGRNLEVPDLLNEFIQTDAMIDRGSSGGPLVDLEGRVVGINSRGQGRGIGFTIPIDTAVEVMAEIEKGGVARGWLGVAVQPLDRDLAAYLGIPDATGVILNGVTAASPAADAGLRPGDVVTALDGTPVEAEQAEDLGGFQRRVAAFPPGAKVAVALLRDGRPRTVSVRLTAAPKVEPADAEADVGFQVQEITENLFRDARLDSRRGAYVTFVESGSPAAEAGLQPGDVVERVDESEVDDLDDFRRAMAGVSGRPRFLLRARRGSDLMFLLVKRGARPPDGDAAPAGEAPEEPDPAPAGRTE